MNLNERIISIANEGNQFFIYFPGILSYDETRGKFDPREMPTYLDENFNTFCREVGKDYADSMVEKLLSEGKPVFKGPHCPEKILYNPETEEEYMVPNTDSSTVGIWRLSTKEELAKYQRVLAKQNAERTSIKLA